MMALGLLRARLYLWVMLPSSPASVKMVPYFAQHYEERVGVDTKRRVTVLLHRPAGAPIDERLSEALRDAFGIDDSSPRLSVVSNFSSALKVRALNAWIASLPKDAMAIYADLDEFFEYPPNTRRNVLGRMVERVGPNLTFPALRDFREGISIADQPFRQCRRKNSFTVERGATTLAAAASVS
mmetsp:Transcript_32948/g.105115  ORF Transcript_32948/g.105115 Transcript_32948/m.105115 type:complete len:183 (+) Transcript_32948:75-623(+)